MKKNIRKIAMAAAALVLLAGCSCTEVQPQTEEALPPVAASEALQEETPKAESADSLNKETGTAESTEITETGRAMSKPEEKDNSAATAQGEMPPTAEMPESERTPTPIPEQPVPTPQPAPQDTPTVPTDEQPTAPAEEPPTPAPDTTPAEEPPAPMPAPAPEETPAAPAEEPPAYGAIPFSLAEGTGKWWHIDSSDSAYWAVAEQINAMRAAGGLELLVMDETLSATASSRCESFVAGGPFDHSGMVTRSEICASGGPLGSAAAVCAAWQASENHYANIMEPSFTRMGVSCWFCAEAPMQMTYWTVTFE